METINKKYYIMANLEKVGGYHSSKKLTIDIFLQTIKEYEKSQDEYLKQQAKKYKKMIKNEKVEVIEVIEKIDITFNKETLKSED